MIIWDALEEAIEDQNRHWSDKPTLWFCALTFCYLAYHVIRWWLR